MVGGRRGVSGLHGGKRGPLHEKKEEMVCLRQSVRMYSNFQMGFPSS